MALNDALIELRKKHRKTQHDIAIALGIPRSTYSNYETGLREPDLNTIVKLAELFNVPTDYLLSVPADVSGTEKNDKSPIDNIGQEAQNLSHKGDTEQDIDPEWQDLYEKVMEKGAKIEATALLRAVADGRMSKKKLEALLMAFDFIEKDDD